MQYDGIIKGRPVRENFDFVSFENYQIDMAETSEQAACALKELRKRAERAEWLIGLLVLSAGGKISVPNESLYDPRQNITLTTWRNDCDCMHVFEAKRG